jgi:hypothetical protein
MRTSKLKELSVAQFEPKRVGNPINGIGFTEKAFGPHVQDLILIPGLCGLTKLRLDASSSHWKLYELPLLEELHLGRACPLKAPTNGGHSKVQSLVLNLPTELFCWGQNPFENADLFFDRFPALKRLTILLYNSIPISENPAELDPSFRRLVSILRSVRQRLESFELRLVPGEDASFLKKVDGLLDLDLFKQLRHVVLPFDAALIFEGRDPYPPSLMFPNTLETLEVLHSRTGLAEWISRFADRRGKMLPKLQEIYIYARPECGDDVEEMGPNSELQNAIQAVESVKDVCILYFTTNLEVELERHREGGDLAGPKPKGTKPRAPRLTSNRSWCRVANAAYFQSRNQNGKKRKRLRPRSIVLTVYGAPLVNYRWLPRIATPT